MFQRGYKPSYDVPKNHWLRNAIGDTICRIFGIIYQTIPVMIILWFCGVISIDIKILIAIWIGYQLLHFIGDIIDHFIEKHDEEERQKYFDGIKVAFNPAEYEEEEWKNGIDPGFHDLKEGD